MICLAVDPANPDRLYASVIHSATGGIFVSNDIQLGGASTWQPLAPPPRTQGHPFGIHVLDDGTLVCTYSGRRLPSGSPVDFTDSSGVFSSSDGGASWQDRSDQGMIYWTRDLTVDPHDPTQSTWYVGVFSGFGPVGAGLPPPQTAGGLYRTRDRGLTWQRISDRPHVTAATVDPADADVLYFTTEDEGLWFCDDAGAAAPSFNQVASYPFRQPERVYFNPFDPTEVWVTSFGNGLRVGSLGVPAAGCGDCNGDTFVSVLDALAAAQHATGLIQLAPAAFAACNVTGTLGNPAVPGATLDVLDALTLARFATGQLASLSCAP